MIKLSLLPSDCKFNLSRMQVRIGTEKSQWKDHGEGLTGASKSLSGSRPRGPINQVLLRTGATEFDIRQLAMREYSCRPDFHDNGGPKQAAQYRTEKVPSTDRTRTKAHHLGRTKSPSIPTHETARLCEYTRVGTIPFSTSNLRIRPHDGRG